MKKTIRQAVYAKHNGRCGYCGKHITYKQMQVDHILPKCAGGANHIGNLMPSCRRCNHYKRSLTVSEFRKLMATLHERISDIYIAKVAIDYGIIEVKPFDNMFYFEKDEALPKL